MPPTPLLLNCPFCGHPGEHHYANGAEKVGCFNPACPMKAKASSRCEGTATANWNTREPSAYVAPAWIPAAERIPDSDITVIIFAPDADPPVYMGYYDDENEFWRIIDGSPVNVTHWQNLPAEPEAPKTPAKVELPELRAGLLPDTPDLIASLSSDLCPACGGHKKPAQSLCVKDYRRLPKARQQALYNRIGEGYEQAMTDAFNVLGLIDFHLPPKKGGKAK